MVLRLCTDDGAGLAWLREVDVRVRRGEDRVGRADDGADSGLRHRSRSECSRWTVFRIMCHGGQVADACLGLFGYLEGWMLFCSGKGGQQRNTGLLLKNGERAFRYVCTYLGTILPAWLGTAWSPWRPGLALQECQPANPGLSKYVPNDHLRLFLSNASSQGSSPRTSPMLERQHRPGIFRPDAVISSRRLVSPS